MDDLREKTKINTFQDLLVWQIGHELVLGVYKETLKFPKEEVFGLTSQMSRAAVSITSNIAEGFGRQTFKEKLQFFFISQGSLTELKNQLLISKDIGYLGSNSYNKLMTLSDRAHQLLQGLIKTSKTFVNRKS